MHVWGVSDADLSRIANEVGVEMRGTAKAFRILPIPGGRYQRLSHDGTRRVHAVCWHGHRDFMVRLFDEYPEARLKSAMADYRGRDDFIETHEATASRNIGSIMNPTQYGMACLCHVEALLDPLHGAAR